MAHIEVTGRTWVKPSKPTFRVLGNVPLSDWDVVMFKSYIPILLFYDNREKSPDFMDTTKLRDALASLLVDYFPLAGRLVDIGKGRDAINCNDAGVLFQEAEYDDDLERFKETGYLPSQMDYHRMFPIHFYTGPKDPLVAIQHTRFRDGGVALGIMILHKIADSYSGCLFLDAWAKHARGVAHNRPLFDRDLVAFPFRNVEITDQVLDYYRREHRCSDKQEHVLRINPSQTKYARTAPGGPMPLKSIILEFYADGLHQCKKDAHTPEMIRKKNWLSTKDALLAMLLRAIVRSRASIKQDEPVEMVLGVNGRSKMKNSREMERYFGNWMVNRSVSITKQQVAKTDLVSTAMAFRQQTSNVDESLFHGISKLYTIHEDMTVNYLSYRPNSSTHVTASDVSMLPYWRLDFGYGRPDRTRGYITFGGDGCLVLFGRSDEQKGPMYDVQIQMDVDSMQRFVNDPDVKKYTHRVLGG